MIKPPVQEFGERHETRFCANITCAAQHTVHLHGLDVSQGEIDSEFRREGWRPAPYIGGDFCPTHSRQP